jgi:hypothetical protein
MFKLEYCVDTGNPEMPREYSRVYYFKDELDFIDNLISKHDLDSIQSLVEDLSLEKQDLLIKLYNVNDFDSLIYKIADDSEILEENLTEKELDLVLQDYFEDDLIKLDMEQNQNSINPCDEYDPNNYL